MIVLLIASYVSIPPALALLTEVNDDFMILTPDKNIYDFMSIMFDKNKIELFEIPIASLKTFNPVTLLHNIKQINNYKKKVLQVINSIHDCVVYFDLVMYCDFEFWIIKKLSKRNKIFYLPSTERKNIAIDQQTMLALWYGFLNRAIYHTKLKPCLHGTDLTLLLTDDFLHDVGATIYQQIIDYNNLSLNIRDKFNLKIGKVLLLCGGVVDYIVEKEKYIKAVDEIIDFVIEKYGEDNIYIKAHPRFQEYYSKENQLKNIPAFLPAPLVTDLTDIVIGYSSSALFLSTLIGKKVVSFLKMIEPTDKRKFPALIEFLNTNMDKSNPIYFPETIDELKSLLNSFDKGDKND